MFTPWGDIPVSDAHVHFFSDGFFRLLAKQKEGLTKEAIGAQLGWEMPPEDPVELGARWVAELDRRGVRKAAIMASIPGDEVSVEAAVKAYPERFFGYFMVNPLAPHAVEHVRAALAAGNLRVPCLFPAMQRYWLHEKEAVGVIEAASETGKGVVFVHCGVLSVGVRKRLGLSSPFDLRFSNPADVHGLAMRFPGVRFVIPHFGAGYFREALMVADLCPNVYLDTSSSNSWMRYQEGELTPAKVLRKALDVVGAGRLLFGTDSSFFPRGWQESIFREQTAALEEIGAGAEDAAAILGGNLERLLG
ncbi:MAG: amidohydrolase [Bryobacterales bacterium]|nr:amidohydrolase [Bryobacterales bacterium]